MNNPIDQFIKGQQDCRDGLPAQSYDDAYRAGYNLQFEVIKTLENKSWAK